MRKRMFKFFIFVITIVLALLPIAVVSGNILSLSVGENLTYKNSSNIFYSLDEDSVDVLFLGSSAIGYGVSPAVLWHETGITSVVRWCGYQNALMNYYYLLDSLAYQDPSLVVIDAKTLMFNLEDYKVYLEPYLHSALDNLPMSAVKREAIDAVADMSDNPLYTKLGYYLKFFRYYAEISNLAYVDELYSSYYDGMITMEYDLGSADSVNQVAVSYENMRLSLNDDIYDYDSDAYDYFVRLIAYCQDQGITVCIVSFPSADWSSGEHNLIEQIATTYDVNFVDYNMPDELAALELDVNEDFHDSLHLNNYGKIKLTENLAEYIVENYDLSDHRGEEGYAEWDTWYDEFAANYNY